MHFFLIFFLSLVLVFSFSDVCDRLLPLSQVEDCLNPKERLKVDAFRAPVKAAESTKDASPPTTPQTKAPIVADAAHHHRHSEEASPASNAGSGSGSDKAGSPSAEVAGSPKTPSSSPDESEKLAIAPEARKRKGRRDPGGCCCFLLLFFCGLQKKHFLRSGRWT